MPSASNETLTALADYRLVQWLGHGNHGDVYLADAPSRLDVTQSQVAVKVLAKGASEDGFRRAIRRITTLLGDVFALSRQRLRRWSSGGLLLLQP